MVISTLHQILKEAAAQQQPALPGRGSCQPGLSPPLSPAMAAPTPHRAPYFIQDTFGPVPMPTMPLRGSGNVAASPPVGAAGYGVQLRMVGPQDPRSPLKATDPSPDAVAAYQAASAAAAAGYFGGGPESELSLDDDLNLSQSLSSRALSSRAFSQALSSGSSLPPPAAAMARPLSNGQLVSLGDALAHVIDA